MMGDLNVEFTVGSSPTSMAGALRRLADVLEGRFGDEIANLSLPGSETGNTCAIIWPDGWVELYNARERFKEYQKNREEHGEEYATKMFERRSDCPVE
jgi:hypothetical protein